MKYLIVLLLSIILIGCSNPPFAIIGDTFFISTIEENKNYYVDEGGPQVNDFKYKITLKDNYDRKIIIYTNRFYQINEPVVLTKTMQP